MDATLEQRCNAFLPAYVAAIWLLPIATAQCMVGNKATYCVPSVANACFVLESAFYVSIVTAVAVGVPGNSCANGPSYDARNGSPAYERCCYLCCSL